MSTRKVVRNRWFNTSSVPGLIFGPSLTHPEFRDECDINLVMGRYMVDREMPRPSAHAPRLRYADYESGPADFFDAQLRLKRAGVAWESLSPAVRQRFSGGPAALLQFLDDESNRAEAIRLGLVRAAPSSDGVPNANG